MPKHCKSCFSKEFRQSRIRRGDMLRLLCLMYPVRCLECFRRSYVFLPFALLYKPSRGQSAQPPQKAA